MPIGHVTGLKSLYQPDRVKMTGVGRTADPMQRGGFVLIHAYRLGKANTKLKLGGGIVRLRGDLQPMDRLFAIPGKAGAHQQHLTE